ncbi:hypothetical protein Vi05172_g12368 [Venturia inaequalis]|nr:hypothetical protein Vi05172_g12368 [Venturia inaequalis]
MCIFQNRPMTFLVVLVQSPVPTGVTGPSTHDPRHHHEIISIMANLFKDKSSSAWPMVPSSTRSSGPHCRNSVGAPQIRTHKRPANSNGAEHCNHLTSVLTVI